MQLNPDGFVDLQVNGYAGVDFNGPPLSESELTAVCERLQADGVRAFLPTLITAELSLMCERAQRIIRLRERSPLMQAMIPGLHLEGPFLSSLPGYIGAHPAEHACDAEQSSMQRLLDAANGLVRLVTLAPERDADARLTDWLVNQGIIVSAGHTDASMEQMRRAMDAGLSMFTHFGNGCPQMLPRHDNILQRVLSLADRLWISFIADGHHVPAIALSNYLKLCDPHKTIIVTDAIAAAGLGPGIFQLGQMQVEVTDDGAAWAPGRRNFAGAAVTMPQSVGVLRKQCGLDVRDIQLFTCQNPAKLLVL